MELCQTLLLLNGIQLKLFFSLNGIFIIENIFSIGIFGKWHLVKWHFLILLEGILSWGILFEGILMKDILLKAFK